MSGGLQSDQTSQRSLWPGDNFRALFVQAFSFEWARAVLNKRRTDLPKLISVILVRVLVVIESDTKLLLLLASSRT